MPHPEMELKSEFDKSLRSSIQPIYPSTELLSNRGISNRVICKFIEQIFTQTGNDFFESISKELINQYKLISKSEAIFNIHFSKRSKFTTKVSI